MYLPGMSTPTDTAAKGSAKAYNAPVVELYEATPDARGFFEAVLGFENMKDLWFRVSAKTQRRYFGNVPFGKKAVRVTQTGTVEIFKTNGFGKDWDKITVAFDHAGKRWFYPSTCEDAGTEPGKF